MDEMQGGAPDKGVSQMLVDTNQSMMKLIELVSQKYPEIGQKLVQAQSLFSEAVDDLTEPSEAPPKGKPMPATTTQEAGAADVQPML